MSWLVYDDGRHHSGAARRRLFCGGKREQSSKQELTRDRAVARVAPQYA
ncbi:hypothetical protein [Arthrobacter methylotrophus]